MALGLAAATAHAGDVEYVGHGTRALGRGGAFAARADDPMALTYDPAALADLPGTQLLLNVHNAFHAACVTRQGTYGDQVLQDATSDRFGDFVRYRNVPYPRVCQNNHINPGLWLAATTRLSESLGVGFGIMTPSAAGHLVWGDGKGATLEGSLPSPVRYQLIEQDIKLIEPTVGVGYRVTGWLSVGVSLQSGLALIKNANMTVLNGTENPNEDTFSELSVRDFFVPAAIFSVHMLPSDSVDVVAFARVSDAIRASGDVNVRVPAFSASLTKDASDNVTLSAPQPAYAGLALRYAQRNAARGGDPMAEEVWDLELDATYHFSSQFNAIDVSIPSLPLAGLPNGIEFSLPHEWKDQASIRIGGDYNVIAGVLALRAGTHYETSAINGSYIGLDFQPAQRLGLHLGATYRIGRFDLSLAYAHIFQETVTVPKAVAAYRQVADAKPLVVNAGTYTAHFDVVSLGGSYRFGSLN